MTPVDAAWLEATIARLESGPEFEWNRETPSGRKHMKDTMALLRGLLGKQLPRRRWARRKKVRR